MNNPLHAPFYADHAVQQTVEVVENVKMARDTYRLRFCCPQMAQGITPGQFLMVKLAGFNDPLIGRPLALYQTTVDENGHPECVDVVYVVKGKLTSRLQHVEPGQQLEVWGPLGNGFPAEPVEHLIMVAGGIGYTPFVAVCKEILGKKQYGQPARQISPTSQKVTLCYGARSADLLAGVDDFQDAGADVRICTDDGTRGHHGLVTELLEQVLNENELPCRIVCCGPEPMMEAVAKIAIDRKVTCFISLETPMACGIGICFTCVAKIYDDSGESDYKRTCVEGPVFEANKIEWR
jgi:dihydroorotate dehydrogenase electron transfer subunit